MSCLNSIYKLFKIFVLLLTSLVCISGSVYAGQFEIGKSTRIIFDGELKRITFPVTNKSKQAYVFHGQVVTPNNDEFSPNFIVTPEVVHLQPGETRQVQIVLLNGTFAEDRETLFYLQGHFLPSETRELNDNASMKINLSYVLYMKMFYRPKELKDSFDAVDKVADKLDFERKDKYLSIVNKSAYFLTINYLSSEARVIAVPDEMSMIPPFGKVTLEVKDRNISSVTWSLINDAGFATDPQSKKIK